MVMFLTTSALVISFLVTLLIMPYWIRRAETHGLVARDMHKQGRSVAELGGIAVICGFLAGLLYYIAIDVFVYSNGNVVKFIFAAISSVLIATIMGLTDDILGWKIGLRQYQKVILTIAIVFPIMVVNAGQSVMRIPFFGFVDFGLVYPLVLVPLALIGTSNAFNMVAGYNGLEAGLGIIILSTLGYLSYVTGSEWVAIIAFCMVAACISFLFFNYYPAQVFPGDALTYPLGALIGIIAILGDIETFAVILFIPYFIEFFLKARGKMQKESFARVLKDGTLIKPYRKYYGIEHVMVSVLRRWRGRARENEVVLGLWLFQLFFAGIAVVYRMILVIG